MEGRKNSYAAVPEGGVLNNDEVSVRLDQESGERPIPAHVGISKKIDPGIKADVAKVSSEVQSALILMDLSEVPASDREGKITVDEFLARNFKLMD